MSKPPRGRSHLAKVALVFIPSMLAFALFELVLRLVFPLDLGSSQQHRFPHPRLGWALEPNASYNQAIGPLEVRVSYNSRGFRDVEHAPEARPGVERIVVLGDSFMEGYSVAMDDLFARQLERRLSQAGHPVEVINLGVGGFGTLQELLAFREDGLPKRPDRVLLGFSENDLSNDLHALERMDNPEGSLKSASRPFLSPGEPRELSMVDYSGALARFERGLERERSSLFAALGRNSVVVQQAERGIKRISRIVKQRRKFDAEESATSAEHCGALYGEAWRVTERILARLAAEVSEAGAELWLFTVPFVDRAHVHEARAAASCQPCSCPTSTPPPSQLAQICQRLGIPLVDLYRVTSALGAGDPKRFYHAEDAHWNAAGHALAAKAVGEALLQRPPSDG